MGKPINEREIVLAVLLEITEHGVYSHIALKNVLDKYQYLDKKERAFITRVTDGTLEHMIELDYILNQFSKVKVRKMKPVIRAILRSGVYQLYYMDTVPDSAVCNEAVKLAVKKGFGSLKGFVNGVLRNVARNRETIRWPEDPLEALSVKYSMPKWIIELWQKEYDPQTIETMLADFQKEKPVTIRCNTSRISTEKLEEMFEEQGIFFERHPYLPYAYKISRYDHLGELEGFWQGLFTVQDISSMLVASIAAPDKDAYVIDVCAAPGGKAIHMADLLCGTGQVEARDLTEYKVGLIQENIDRMQFENIVAKQMDATKLVEESIEKADVVIADLPCSGLGVLGKKTDLKYKTEKEQVEQLAALQRQILDTVWKYVKSNGALIYSTCTITPQENMENVNWFLKNHKEFVLEPMEPYLCEALQAQVKSGCLQLLPGVHDSDGFFIAKFRRKE